MNKILILSIVVLQHGGGEAFVPPHPRAAAVATRSAVPMVKTDEPETMKKKKREWWEDPIAAMQEWFDTVTKESITPEKQQETDWVSKEFNEMAEDEEMVLVEEAEEVEEGDDVVVEQEAVVLEAEEEVEEEIVAPPSKKKVTAKSKLVEGKDDWITRDMERAGLGQDESQDWVAEDLAKTGKTVGVTKQSDWVAKDMTEAGTAASARAFKTKDMRSKSKNVLIREDMEKTGHVTGSKDVAYDMKRTGSYGGDPNYSVMDTLNQKLNKEREKAYDDVYDDMEKTGKVGSQSKDWVAKDMARAGTAEHERENLVPLEQRDGSFSIGGWLKKTFDPDQVREDMEEAGHASSRDWVAGDMREVGRNYTSLATRAPKQDKDLAESLNARGREGEIAHDMQVEGMAEQGLAHLDSNLNKNMEDLVAEDMKKVGGSQTSSWVERDMIEAGHATPQAPTGPHISHKERETKAFMATRKVKRADPIVQEEEEKKKEEVQAVDRSEEHINAAAWRVVRPAKKAAAATEEEEEHHEEHHLRDTLIHAAKKVIHPLTKWEDL